jgi:hypothetical protein
VFSVIDQEIPDSVNHDWVRANLLELKTVCEVSVCTQQAAWAHRGRKYVVYLCELHHQLVEHKPQFGKAFERDMNRWFNEMYNFITQVEQSHGQLLVDLDELEATVKAAIRDDDKNKQRAETEFMKALEKYRRKQQETIKVGAPDDGLMEARGARPDAPEELGPALAYSEPQSPPRSTQPVLRITERTAVPPVILPPSPRTDTLIFVSPIQGRQ